MGTSLVSCFFLRHSVHGSLANVSLPSSGISIGSSVFAGFTAVTNGQTNRQTTLLHDVCVRRGVLRIKHYQIHQRVHDARYVMRFDVPQLKYQHAAVSTS